MKARTSKQRHAKGTPRTSKMSRPTVWDFIPPEMKGLFKDVGACGGPVGRIIREANVELEKTPEGKESGPMIGGLIGVVMGGIVGAMFGGIVDAAANRQDG